MLSCESPLCFHLPAANLLGMLSNKGAPPIPSRRISSSGSRQQSSAQQQQQLQAQRAAAAASAAAAVKRLSGRDLEHLQQLHAFFCGLGDDMAGAVQRLALQGFNQWLVSNARLTAGRFVDGGLSVDSRSSAALACSVQSCIAITATMRESSYMWVQSPSQMV
jgi:hypothetical protein